MPAGGPVSEIRKRRQSGSAVVEFAWVLLPLLGMLFLLMGLAWVIFAWACVQEAVREGARTAVTCTPSTGLNSAIQQTVETYSFGFVNANNAASVFNVSYYDPNSLAQISSGQVYSGDVVKVSIKNLPIYGFAPILHANSPIMVSAISSDILSCPSPATP